MCVILILLINLVFEASMILDCKLYKLSGLQ